MPSFKCNYLEKHNVIKGGYTMYYGYVKSWDSSKGYGFITTEDDEDLFVHVSGLDITVKENKLREGQKVAFDIQSDYKGDRAVNVRIIK